MSCNWLAIRISLLIAVFVTTLAGTATRAQGSTVVRVEPSASIVQINETVNVAIKVDNVNNLTAFEIHLTFNPAILEVTGVTNGGFVAADFVAQNTFDNGAGSLDYGVAQMNRPPAQGSGTLLNISFRAKAAGTSALTTRPTQAAPVGLLLADQNGMSIQAAWTPGTINVGTSTPAANTSTPTPTPTSTTSTLPITPGTTRPTSTPTPTSTTSTGSTPPGSNTPTFTPTSTARPTFTPTPGTPGTHIVRFGEWIFCIARAYRVSPAAIIQANRLWWPYIIFPNQRLSIPNVPWTNMTPGPVCQAQFTFPTPTPTPTATPPTPVVTLTPPTSAPTVTPIPVTTSPPSTCRAIYVVRRGDTLYRIALRYGISYAEIARVNHIANPRLIYPGQQLCIP